LTGYGRPLTQKRRIWRRIIHECTPLSLKEMQMHGTIVLSGHGLTVQQTQNPAHQDNCQNQKPLSAHRALLFT
jgi:hypothetical protein